MKDNGVNIFKTSAFQVKLAKNQTACIKVDPTTGLIKNGKKNDYPTYLLFLYNNHPEHGGIVRGKARYISGLSIKPVSNNEKAELWLKRANPSESWYDVRVKTDKDEVIFGGYYLKVHTNGFGKPVWVEHLPWAQVRKTDKDNYVICEDFENYTIAKKVVLPKFTPGMVGTSVYEFKTYTPTAKNIEAIYPQTEYTSGILDIDTDIRVGTFFNSIVKNNFSAGTIVTIFNGETDPKKKEAIVAKLKVEYEGEDEAGKTAVVFVGKDGKPTEVTRLNANDLDKQYKEVNARNIQKIVAAHNVPAELFKIRLDNKALLSRTEYAQLHELFINEYAIPKQANFNETVRYFYKLSTGFDETFEAEQIKLIGNELPLDNQNVIQILNQKDPNIVFNYIVDRFNIDVPKAELNTLTPSAVVTTPTEANEHLKNLTGKQFQNLMRVVAKFEKGLITQDAAVMMLTSAFNITNEQALMFLNVASESDDEFEAQIKQAEQQTKEALFFEIAAKYAHKVVDDLILDEYEVKNKALKLAEDEPTDELKNTILDLLKGNPFASAEDLAKQLNQDPELIKKAIDWLILKNLIEANEGLAGYTPTSKGMDMETGETVEVYTEYTYELRPDAPRMNGGKIIKPRDFCAKMVALYGSKDNALSFEAIDKMRNEFGDNVWDFRGGFYTNGKTGETTPWCRHYWKATVKARKKKK